MNMINVACGIIRYNNKLLMSQRSKHKYEYPLLWEFTGGKFEKNEQLQQCLIREIKEELNIDVIFDNIVYHKRDNKYCLFYCACHTDDISNIKLREYEVNDYKLVSTIAELKTMDLIPGDMEIVQDCLYDIFEENIV